LCRSPREKKKGKNPSVADKSGGANASAENHLLNVTDVLFTGRWKGLARKGNQSIGKKRSVQLGPGRNLLLDL